MLIKDRRLQQALLRALADEPSARILAATAYRTVSVMELIRQEGIASSSAYRHIHELAKNGLLVVARTVLTPDGKTYQMYRATFREVTVTFHAGELVIHATPNLDAVQKAFRLFHSFTEEL
ncbi:MAG TPA: helix-turn-helix domain-containing protein [Thermoplasmata archaeon]|nr:helix-turn-helix domain-containing protein [Thermoplasmata archaeon]